MNGHNGKERKKDMKNTFGNSISLTVFGESHGKAVGAVLDGLPAGLPVEEAVIREALSLRRPFGDISTARREPDDFEILSGVFGGKTCGTPLCIVIKNEDVNSASYEKNAGLARPGHADYTAHIKYGGFEDYRGGGHFSGRVTAGIVAVCAVLRSALLAKGIRIGSHIAEIAGVSDESFSLSDENALGACLDSLSKAAFPVISEAAGEEMKKRILLAKEEKDSVGGILETCVTGLAAGVGEPFFDSLESELAHAIFSVGGVKGIEFGDGFALARMRGSEANDAMRYENGKVSVLSHHAGGIYGGISAGTPILFRTAIKPTPSIGKKQETIDFHNTCNAELENTGRHDPCIVHRTRAVVEALTAFVLFDALAESFGSGFFRAEK